MITVLIINGHDYSKYIKRSGFSWKRNDLDSAKATRTKDGTMRRDKVTTKRTLDIQLTKMSEEKLAALDDDLQIESFSVTYHDLHGTQTRTMYCTSLTASMQQVYDDEAEWRSAKFTLVEV